jgi:predicted GNAT family acetyltransferase
MIESRKIDSKRMVIFPIDTIEEFRTQAVRIIDKYIEQPKEERKPLMFVLDSLGMLATNKEVQDATDDKNVRDMTKAQLTKSVFRVLTLKLGKANIPMLVTNHTYDVIGCALKETMVKTPNGNVDISKIKVGDYVNTMVGPKKVITTYGYSFNEYYQIELENGSIYNLTGEHKLMTQDGEWKKVSELTKEDIIINIGN